MSTKHSLTAILPCNNVAASSVFYARLGFTNKDGDGDYLILSDGKGGEIHLTNAVEGWLIPGKNPFGLYLYTEGVDELAASLHDIALNKPENKPWGMYEFAVSDPDETLVRIGWPTRLRNKR
jgi:hypothetical protein